MDNLDFWQQVNELIETPENKIFYRLYYDDNGSPLFYSMEDLPGNYIEIDRETFARSNPFVRVVNNKLVDNKQIVLSKLVPGTEGIPCHKSTVVLVDPQSTIRWKTQTYESNN